MTLPFVLTVEGRVQEITDKDHVYSHTECSAVVSLYDSTILSVPVEPDYWDGVPHVSDELAAATIAEWIRSFVEAANLWVRQP
jgi:hypothetical protein